jgi:hypothetical protein
MNWKNSLRLWIIPLGILFSVTSYAQELPWLDLIDPEGNRDQLHTLSTEAMVSVSDGSGFLANTLYHDPQRAVFQQVYDDSTETRGIEGKYFWQYDGEAEVEVDPFFETYILGHQMHAYLLFFDHLSDSLSSLEKTNFRGNPCLQMTGWGPNVFSIYLDETNSRPIAMELHIQDNQRIQFEFEDWKPLGAYYFPHKMVIDDGERVFQYDYKTIGLNKGHFSSFRAPDPLLTEEQRLIRRHRTIMDAHLFEEASLIKEIQSDSLVIVSAGDIFQMAGNQPNSGIERILSNRNYLVYDDMVRPIVQVSDDGTLGWVIVQVEAEGYYFNDEGGVGDPIYFVCAWIEMYEKVEGAWKMKGNVSNFRQSGN